MRVAVVGSRGFSDYVLLSKTLAPLEITQIVSGGAIGADILGARYANENNIPLLEFIPVWYKNGVYDNSAGFKRNKDIVNASDIVYAFWDGVSKGTKSTIDFAKKIGVKSVVILYQKQLTEEGTDLWKIL
jgi:hypothetical protein